MTQVKIVKPPTETRTPSQEIVEDAHRVVDVVDESDRVIGIGRVDTSIRRRVFKILSAESANKDRYLGMVFLAASVRHINGETVRFPTSEAQFDALIDRLGDEGMGAVGIGQRDHFLPKDEDGVGE